jgi:hypothetical protein
MAGRHILRRLCACGAGTAGVDGSAAGTPGYLVCTGLTALSHLGFATLADGFWSGMLMRALAGIGWAGAYFPGLKAIADRWKARRSRARSPGMPPSLASPERCLSLSLTCSTRTECSLPVRCRRRGRCLHHCGHSDASRPGSACNGASESTARLPAGISQPTGNGVDRRLHSAHLGVGSPPHWRSRS